MPVREEQSLQSINTLAAPAVAEQLWEAHSRDEVMTALAQARTAGQPVSILGGGSNVLLPSRVEGLVLRPLLTHIRVTEKHRDAVSIDVGAGVEWHDLVNYSLDHGWFGLENLALIPGLVGAAPIQNIGAYGVELHQVLEAVDAIEIATGRQRRFSRDECGLGYRDSVFKGPLKGRYVIVSIVLRLSTTAATNLSYPALHPLQARLGRSPTPREVADEVVRIRREKLPDPKTLPNAGSFFKNPWVSSDEFERLQRQHPAIVGFPVAGGVKLAAAWLIDQRGWKNRSVAGLRVHESQALVLTNPQRLSLENILEAAEAIAKDVREYFQVELEIEPQRL